MQEKQMNEKEGGTPNELFLLNLVYNVLLFYQI